METVRGKGFSGFIKKYRLLAWCILTAAAALAICSKSSLLYPFNDWVDANCYFTVGKGMMGGLVPYRDLVEQKGVLIYFLHGLCYLVSHTTFIGVYFLEVIAGTAYLYYAAKTAALFVHEKWGYVITPVLAALVYSSAAFAHGDSAEELCLPLLMFGLYGLMRFFKNEGELTPRITALCGVMAGCVLWIKYTMLGFWAGWMLAVFVGLLLIKKPQNAFKACLWFLAGVALATVPWLVYFAANGALSDWFRVYFYLNFTVYPKTHGLAEMLDSAWSAVYGSVTASPVLLVSIVVALLGFVCTNKFIKGVWPKVCFVLAPALLALGVYAGGRTYPYYFLIMMGMLLLPGLIVLSRALSGLAGAFSRMWSKPKGYVCLSRIVFAAVCTAALTLSCAYAYNAYQYRGFMETDKAALAQYRFADIMDEEENPTLLNYGFLDGGFYTAADILPGIKYFCKLNLSWPEMTEAQQRAIQDKATQFVVLRCDGKNKEYGSDVPYLLDNYDLVETVRQEFERRDFVYCLFKAKEGA